jgi:hypothetical protein
VHSQHGQRDPSMHCVLKHPRKAGRQFVLTEKGHGEKKSLDKHFGIRVSLQRKVVICAFQGYFVIFITDAIALLSRRSRLLQTTASHAVAFVFLFALRCARFLDL